MISAADKKDRKREKRQRAFCRFSLFLSFVLLLVALPSKEPADNTERDLFTPSSHGIPLSVEERETMEEKDVLLVFVFMLFYCP